MYFPQTRNANFLSSVLLNWYLYMSIFILSAYSSFMSRLILSLYIYHIYKSLSDINIHLHLWIHISPFVLPFFLFSILLKQYPISPHPFLLLHTVLHFEHGKEPPWKTSQNKVWQWEIDYLRSHPQIGLYSYPFGSILEFHIILAAILLKCPLIPNYKHEWTSL